jgi:hypothetical protein
VCAIALGAWSCARQAVGPTLTIADLHAHDQPVVLSQRVAIDEEPCEGAALTALGELRGTTLGYTTDPARPLRATLVGPAGAAPSELQRASVRGGSLQVVLGNLAMGPRDPEMGRMRTGGARTDDPCDRAVVVQGIGVLVPRDLVGDSSTSRSETIGGGVRCFAPVHEARAPSDTVVVGEVVGVSPQRIHQRCRRGGAP